jgi:large subunit ribosomal protein L1
MTQRARAKAKELAKAKKRKSRHKEYKYAAPSIEEQYSLCDAMRYVWPVLVPFPLG